MTGFAARLRRATMSEHRDAETRGFITRLLGGAVPPAGFAALTAQYLIIYRELEAAAVAMRANPVAADFADPALSRIAALESDLAHLYGPDWAAHVRPVPATQRYADRLREHCHTSPAHFVAHHYVRYLGDLSGGQLVGRKVAATYGLGSAGTAFYRFDRIADPKAYKTAYRTRLDALGLPDAALDTLVAESQLAFALNAAVFHELGTAYPEDLPAAA
ncbi:heme oxygenase [Actinoplanes ianthinogenes]|uniref:Heme oxygenase n=1 Tax=Actinoplanes ianthinogenes TaxID=122358 RepID=A0ABM7LXP2_9ACTN|nr:biliverdin-producing heme oxygenase [Actinoplanes ianthinogenes]BCJ44097.1 heme oxygenase [Actinoplanes ianthinogenes]GGQ95783.1 heme oxygenase [Actinoplanes ianthinogenes]